MVYSLSYRRPAHVSSSQASLSGSEKASSFGKSSTLGNSYSSVGIPDALSFERVISGGTCPPCTTRDFMNYLVYVEHAAENLQFYLWFHDYSKRFFAMPACEQALAPEWTQEKQDADTVRALADKINGAKTLSSAMEIFKDTDFEVTKPPAAELDPRQVIPFYAPSQHGESGGTTRAASIWDEKSTLHSPVKMNYKKQAASAFEAVDVKIQPFTIQPFRDEIARIIPTYISDGSPRQLNLASKERSALLRTLATTTHPSAFRQVVHTVEWSLRHQAHPNFIRWSICNGNLPRVVFGRGVGVTGIACGIITAVLLTLSTAPRGYRALSAIPFVIGVATLIAGCKGVCVVLLGRHRRHLRPWEFFLEDDDNDDSSLSELKKGSMDTFGSSNSFETEPWIAGYDKRHLVRKVFDREVWIKEPALRGIQDTIFLQALLGGLAFSCVVMGLFLPLPVGKMF